MRTVKIADDVYAALQRWAVPFEDDINDVLRRVLDLAGHPHGNQSNGAAHTEPQHINLEADDIGTVIVHRRSNGNGHDHLPQSTYRNAVLGVLKSAHTDTVVSELLRDVERQLADRMTEADLQVMASGITRWQSQTRNALTQLEYEGAIERVSDGVYRYRDASGRHH